MAQAATDDVRDAQTKAAAQRLLARCDLTRLEAGDPPERIRALCALAGSPHGAPAAVCVYPAHVGTARSALDALGLQRVRVAAVANFPTGLDSDAEQAAAIAVSRLEGAAEIDWVLPYRALLHGNIAAVERALAGARSISSGLTLKVIIESGALPDAGTIERASLLAIDAGADFIKTSTGKSAVGATPAAARTMLQAIRQRGGRCGFKAAGGIRSLSQACEYLTLADTIMGPGWASPERFRIGASSLVSQLLAMLGDEPGGTDDGVC